MINERLLNYVKEGLKKGYTKEELRKILEKSNWSPLEISEVFNSLNKNKIENNNPGIKEKKDQILIDFVKQALSKDIPKNKIRQALLEKKWPPFKIDEAILKASKKIEKPQLELKNKIESPKKHFSIKTFFIYLMWFFIISLVLSLSIGVLFYINGMHNYNNGTGKCISQDCSDLREYTLNNITDNSILILSVAGAIALIVLLLYFFIPHKEWLIWIFNILFFLYLIYLAYLWFFG